MSSTQHQLIEQCATRLRGIVEALDNIHDTSPHRWSTDLDDVHSSVESLLAMIKDQAPALDAQGLARAALAQPSPAQAEAEQPEVVAFIHERTGAVANAEMVRAMEEGSVLSGYSIGLVTLAQHDRIFGALRADRDSWAEQAEQRLADWDEMRKERDAALARVAELELKLDKSDYAYDNDRIHMRDLAARAIARAKVFDDGSDGADAESARSVVAILRELLAVGPAQAQHSVPGDIMRDAQRYRWLRDQQFYFSFSTENSDAGISSCTAGMSSRFKNLSWVDAAIDSAIAAAPGKEVPQAWLDVQAERRRQVEAEGWTPEHDDEHSHGQIARAAACYALAGSSAPNDGTAALLVSLAWPWDQQWWKPSTPRRDLVKACALALAEIERLDRACISQSPQPGATTASS
ncbi:hypothetical protein LSP16_23225 [Pseudomonas aeruginosa]|uniref:hypothetical protein n=1 Tax=Pseudomonas aeruginosa TaxID=287 RepID=UPI001F5B9BB5|nr:hypothetical protein [Pseudomonas aeruginosa]UGR49347.2 hypothetical protein LSP16_23225 [Pseudomonas aeruginosa]